MVESEPAPTAMDSSTHISALLRASADGLAGFAAARLFEAREGDAPPPEGFRDWKAHLRQMVERLASAVEVASPREFAEHLAWSREAFSARDVPRAVLRAGLVALQEAVEEALPADAAATLQPYFQRAREEAERAPSPPASTLSTDAGHDRLAHAYVEALLRGDEQAALRGVLAAIDDGRLSTRAALMDVLAPAMREIGRLWHVGDITPAEEHLASQVTRKAVSGALGRAEPAPANGRTVVLASVEGDAHDLGVQLVAAFFELDGWRTIYLGADMPVADLAAGARRFDADLVALGATLPTQREAVARAIQALHEGHPDLPVLVGGAAFPEDVDSWRRVGADAWAGSASEAVRLAHELVRT